MSNMSSGVVGDDDFWALSEETREIYIPNSVPRISIHELEPLTFYRDFVSKNLPVIITDAIDHWPARQKWNHQYLRTVLADTHVNVNVTPTGFGDSVVRDQSGRTAFVLPQCQKLPFSAFVDHLELRSKLNEQMPTQAQDGEDSKGIRQASLMDFGSAVRIPADSNGTIPFHPNCQNTRWHDCTDSATCSRCQTAFPSDQPVTELVDDAAVSQESLSTDSICYLSEQNDCFRSEYKQLWSDLDSHLELATKAFGCDAEAVNFWMGSHESVSSMHKDHYENMYAVIKGEKHFTLLPPTDYHFLEESVHPIGKYVRVDQQWEIVMDPSGSTNNWIVPDLECPADLARYPRAARIASQVLRARVCAGEVLYLPSMWFHRVAQFHGDDESTVAVNWWYDMAFDIKYAYFAMMQKLSDRAKKNVNAMM